MSCRLVYATLLLVTTSALAADEPPASPLTEEQRAEVVGDPKKRFVKAVAEYEKAIQEAKETVANPGSSARGKESLIRLKAAIDGLKNNPTSVTPKINGPMKVGDIGELSKPLVSVVRVESWGTLILARYTETSPGGVVGGSGFNPVVAPPTTTEREMPFWVVPPIPKAKEKVKINAPGLYLVCEKIQKKGAGQQFTVLKKVEIKPGEFPGKN